MPEQEPKSDAAELPPPSAELVLIRVFVQASLATAHEKPKHRARALLARASSILRDEETVALLLPIRSASERASVTRARREALAMFRQLMPTFVAELPPE